MKDSSSRIFFGTVLLGTANISKLALQFLLIPILARLLGPEIFGLMSVAMSFILLANMLSDGGMGAALVREKDVSSELCSTVFWLSSIIGLALAAFVWLSAWPISLMLAQPSLIPVLFALSPILILSSILSVPNALIMRAQRFHLFAAGDFVCAIISAVAGVLFAFGGWGVWSLVIQQLALWVSKFVWVSVAARFRPRFVMYPSLARPLLRFSANNLAASVVDFAGKSAPILVVGRLLGITAVGHYSMAYQLTRVADMVVSSPISMATFSAVAVAHNDRDAASFVVTSLRILTMMLAPVCFGIMLTAELIAPVLLGPKWVSTAPALIALAPGATLVCFYVFVTSALLGKGEAGRVLRLTIFGAIAMTLGSLVGACYSVEWAASGFSLGVLALAPLHLRWLARAMGTPVSRLLGAMAKSLIATCIMGVSVLIARWEFSNQTPTALAMIVIAVGALSYVVASLVIDGRQIRSDIAKIRRQPNADAVPVIPSPAPGFALNETESQTLDGGWRTRRGPDRQS